MKYQKQELLYQGGQGQIWSGVTNSGEMVAIKIIPRPNKLTTKYVRMTIVETIVPKILKSHPNIVELLDHKTLKNSYELVYPWFEINLYEFTPPEDRSTLIQIDDGIFQGLKWMHYHGIVHRDLSPRNIMMNGNTPIIIDFGLSCMVDEADIPRTFKNYSKFLLDKPKRVGTPYYTAPELFSADKFGINLFLTDVYSLGLIYFLIFNKDLAISISSDSMEELERLKFEPHLKSQYEPLIDDLIDQMLYINPEDRLDLTEVEIRLNQIEDVD